MNVCEVCGYPGFLVRQPGPGGMTRLVCLDPVACMDRVAANDPDSDWSTDA